MQNLFAMEHMPISVFFLSKFTQFLHAGSFQYVESSGQTQINIARKCSTHLARLLHSAPQRPTAAQLTIARELAWKLFLQLDQLLMQPNPNSPPRFMGNRPALLTTPNAIQNLDAMTCDMASLEMMDTH